MVWVPLTTNKKTVYNLFCYVFVFSSNKLSTDSNVWKFYLYMSVIIVKDANLRSDGRKEVVELRILEPNDVLNNEGLIKKYQITFQTKMKHQFI